MFKSNKKNYKMKKHIAILCMSLLAFSSCSDFLDVQPEGNTTINNYFTNDQQAIWGSMTAPKAKLTRLKPPKVAEAKPARETKSKLSFTSSPVLPPAEVSKQYKPPPIEAFAEVAAARARVQADKLMQNDQKRQVSRTDVGKITQQLDNALATVTDGDDENPEKKAQARRHMLKFYNFAFNELILVEKDNCSDKAILLRRFKKFYNGMLEEMPGMGE